jgi:Zn-finger nucleic acid-binding protein
MRQYERNRVTVDQCTECRGIFLDRGELERLIDAESRWSGSAEGPQRPANGGRYDDDDRYEQLGGYHSKPHYKKRKKGFLEGLFDD